MIRWIRVLAVIVMLGCLAMPLPVIASSTSVSLVVRASNGVEDFVILYISDTRMDLSWTLTGDAEFVMIRAKWGSYPDDITDPNTAPTDGYLVYYGNNTSVSDTSMDFDETPETLYYAAWGQKEDGTWYMGSTKDWKESVIMTLIAILGFVVAMTYFAFTKRNFGLSFVGAFSWILLLVYTRANPINNIATGSFGDELILFACILMFVILLFTGWRKYREDKIGVGKNAKIIKYYNQAGDYVGRHETPETSPSNRRETAEEYRDRLHNTVMEARQNRRRYRR
jgi:hypothetical protein